MPNIKFLPKTYFICLVVFVLGLSASSKAGLCTRSFCSPLNVPTLVNSTVTATSLLLDWKSTTVYLCPDVIDVELTCNGKPFSGLGVYTYTSAIVTGTSTPYTYPTMTINITSLCPGAIYQFRARERNNGTMTSSVWTPIYSFTTLGTFITPSLNLSATPSVICSSGSTSLSALVTGGCGASSNNYTWTPTSNLSCSNCASPIASPISTVIYSLSIDGGQLGCWALFSNTIQVTVTACTGVKEVSSLIGQISISPNPNDGHFSVRSGLSENFSIHIYNCIGQVVLVLLQNKMNTEIDLSNYGKGIYTILIEADGNYKHLKVAVD
jgi:hypothetical protein